MLSPVMVLIHLVELRNPFDSHVDICNDKSKYFRGDRACAEGFTIISEGVSQKARVQILTPLFLRLLDDTSRYVKMAAYQQLGPFITTFHSGDNDNNESQGDEQKTKSE
eukprot:sb/3477413/